MITIEQWLKAVNFQITETSEIYNQSCNIHNLQAFDFWNGDHEGFSTTIIFSLRDMRKVFSVELCDFKNNSAYRLKDVEYEDSGIAWEKNDGENVTFIEIQDDNNFLRILNEIVQRDSHIDNNENEKVSMEINIPEEDLFKLMLMAHEKDITLNALVNDILRECMLHDTENKNCI